MKLKNMSFQVKMTIGLMVLFFIILVSLYLELSVFSVWDLVLVIGMYWHFTNYFVSHKDYVIAKHSDYKSNDLPLKIHR